MKVENLYQAPKSDALPQPPIEQMLARQSLMGTIIGTFSAGIPSMLLYIIIFNYDFFTLLNIDFTILITIPFLGVVIGMTARVCGSGIERRYQLCCGAITLLLVLIANMFITSHIGLISSLLAVIIASYFSKIKLTEQEKLALSQWQAQNGQ